MALGDSLLFLIEKNNFDILFSKRPRKVPLAEHKGCA